MARNKLVLSVLLGSIFAVISSAQQHTGSSRELLKEWGKAQKAEVKNTERHHKQEMKELKATQVKQRQEWEKKEREQRHTYFAEHTKGPERRAYVQAFFLRREAFLKAQNEVTAEKIRENETRLGELHKEQSERSKKFKQALDEGKTPDQDLWPVVKK